jgi:peptidoglycan/xylan/chitin deacetylase (PgdA/CDA1 family)
MGIIFMMVLTIFIAGMVQSEDVVPAITPTAIQQALARVTATAVNTPTLAPSPTNTATSTPTNTPTQTTTPTETATPTNTPSPTNTLAPHEPTYTPQPPTPTFTPVPLPTPPDGLTWTLRVPILMYHYISVPPEDADVYRLDLSVEPDDFREQMTYLYENGYTTVDFYDLSRAITNNGELPDKPVIITLDDGYRDNYTNAFPILREFGFTATIFIPTEFIDKGYDAYLTWEMIEEMAAAGIRFEPHSRTHPDLRDRERDFLIWEILGPQQTLGAHLGYTPRYFAYPAGRYDETVIEVLDELQFWGAVTTQGGKWHGFGDRFEWTRLRVHNYTVLPEFIDLVELTGYVGGKPVDG